MPTKKKPRKPVIPFGAIVFPKSGSVYKNMEFMPRVQDDIELVIGNKFVGALKQFFGHVTSDLKKAEHISDSADLTCLNDTGLPVHIQITELVWLKRRIIDIQRKTYLEQLSTHVIDLFSGYKLTIVDNGTYPVLPPINSNEGRVYLFDLISKVKEFGNSLATLPNGKTRIKKVTIGSLQVELVFECVRTDSSGQSLGAIVWTGGYFYMDGERDNLLVNEIKKKIDKGYAKGETQFWLLIYSVDILIMPDDHEIVAARKILQSTAHPFDKVWYLFPYSNIDLGHLISLFSNPD